MDFAPKTKHSSGLSASRFLPYITPDWIALFLDLYRALRRFLQRERHHGIYEILDYDSTLELVDPKGEIAVLRKRQKVRFLQNNIIAFEDYAWGDGEIFAEYQCSPGKVVDRYQEGDRWNVLISLRETKTVGDIEDFYIERIVRNGFTKDEEWRQIEIRNRMKRLKLTTIFPKERRCQRAVVVERSRNRTTVLDQKHFSDQPDGRQVLTWEPAKTRRFENYIIKWKW